MTRSGKNKIAFIFSSLFIFFVLFFSSADDGNCLFSSTSIILVGDSSLCFILRALTCLELSLNREFYLDHPIFSHVMDENKMLFKTKEAILNFFLSNKTYKNDLNSFQNYINEEAINMCNNFKFSSFLCVLGLSTVINNGIKVLCPDFEDHPNKMALSHTIRPRQFYQSSSPVCCNVINILFCNQNSSTSKYKGNHFVPLVKKEFNKKLNKHNQVLGATTNFSSKRPKITDTFESISFKTPKLYAYFPPLNKKTDIKPSSKFVSVTNTTATISTISSTTLSNTVTTSACVSSKFSLSTPLVSTNYKIPSQPLHSSPPTLVKNSSSSSQGISKYDISPYYKKSLNLTNIEKNDLIKNVSIVNPALNFQ